ncbi:hypothetical protein M1L58_11075 [Gordonia sp. C13]|nr:hypothetical protein [Gordonia sp. C13]
MTDAPLRTRYLTQDERALLIARWREQHRKYHNLDHLLSVLSSLDNLRSAGTSFDDEAVTLAAWFHDAIYEVGAADNEDQSADLALRMLAGRSCAQEVARLVRATAEHRVDTNDVNASALCDADLAILASDSQRYSKYCADVRDEYSQFEDTLYYAGRSRVLEQLLSLDRLFNTDFGYENWESPARRNLETELRSIRPS